MRSEDPIKARNNEKLASILKICQKMNSERDPGSLLDLIAKEAARLLGADRASIFLLDERRRELWSRVALGAKTIRFDARLGIAGATAMSGEIINVKDAKDDSRFYPEIDEETGYQTLNLLSVPLKSYEGDIIGAFEVLNKVEGPFTDEDQEILQALASNAAIALETAQLFEKLKQHRDELLEENTHLWLEVEGKFATENILGTSVQVQKVVRLIQQISESTVNVLITGESGTGKELVAKAIHHSSPRARRPLVTVNCAALPESLMDSELFGIEKGVATGVECRIGKFETAAGGTLFLDEIGDLSAPAQAKILRALQEKVIERVGGRKDIAADVRVLAATNKDLEEEITKGDFREDLFYRLKVIHIKMPPLRDVSQDIALLANHFLANCAGEMGKEMEFTQEAMECLTHYRWPGNVRQLENEVKRLVASVRSALIHKRDLSDEIQATDTPTSSTEGSLKAVVARTVEQLESEMIRDALDLCQHNQARAAKQLGVSRQGLIKKMKNTD